MKRFPLALKIPLGIAGLSSILYAGWIVWGVFLGGDFFHESMDDSGDLKAVIYEMRQYFHGRSHYEKLSLDELHSRGILDDARYKFVRGWWYHHYYPFSPETPDNAVVLRYGAPFHDGLPFYGETLHKGDFTAGPNDGDIVVH
jgi:hypothetical protein